MLVAVFVVCLLWQAFHKSLWHVQICLCHTAPNWIHSERSVQWLLVSHGSDWSVRRYNHPRRRWAINPVRDSSVSLVRLSVICWTDRSTPVLCGANTTQQNDATQGDVKVRDLTHSLHLKTTQSGPINLRTRLKQEHTTHRPRNSRATLSVVSGFPSSTIRSYSSFFSNAVL